MANPDRAGRAIAGLLGYNPGPGIYSRLERSIQGMPAKIRTKEFPGLLRRYPEGVPGWELKATDLDSVIGGRDVVTRDELLAAVRERSPVYTHREIVLGGNPPMRVERDLSEGSEWLEPARQDRPSPLGQGIYHGEPRWSEYGQRGKSPAEILLIDPQSPAASLPDPHHYSRNYPSAKWPRKFDAPQEIVDAATAGTVSHMRFDRHGDAIRLNELQSDLQNYNIRERRPGGSPVPFAAQDAHRDIQLKRFLLQAARDGSGVEIARPEDIADAVGMPLDHAQHLYGKVYPSDMQRIGRSVGGLVPDATAWPVPEINTQSALLAAIRDSDANAERFLWSLRRRAPGMGQNHVEDEYRYLASTMSELLRAGHTIDSLDKYMAPHYEEAYKAAVRTLTDGNMMAGPARRAAGAAMGEMIERAKAHAALKHEQWATSMDVDPQPGFRARLSDEMRRNLIEKGVGASVLAPLLMQEE